MTFHQIYCFSETKGSKPQGDGRYEKKCGEERQGFWKDPVLADIMHTGYIHTHRGKYINLHLHLHNTVKLVLVLNDTKT